MKKMKEISIACIALMLLLTAVTIPHTLAHTECAPFTTDLIAGGGNPNSEITVGDVRVWNDDDYLYVKYNVPCPWWLIETHLHVAEELSDIPQTEAKGKGKNVGGNPIPGHFEYNHPWCGWTYRIENTWEENDVLNIAAHAVVCSCECGCETAWGDGYGFIGKNWATYFTYTVQ